MRFKNFFALSFSLILSSPGFANDGRDRNVRGSPSELLLFPDPLGEESGYRFLKEDGPGGADGTEMFRWVRPVGASLVRVAAFETTRALGKAAFPMAIFDLTSENGDTPVTMNDKSPPRGRHPGSSHDSGLNMDLGYYLNSVKGLSFTPDLAACTDHFKAREKGSQERKDNNQCLGEADRLATAHEAYFLLELARINRESFGNDLLEEIGIDFEVRRKVLAQLDEWVAAKKWDTSQILREDLARLFTSDNWDGWAGSHHHHVHVRMRDIAIKGSYRIGYESLKERERSLDLALLKKNSSRSVFLKTRLYSQGMNRSIEAELLGALPPSKSALSFQSDSLEPVKADPSRLPALSAQWDLPGGFNDERSDATVKAEVSGETLSATQALPRKPFYLSIAVDPSQIKGRAQRIRNGQALTISLDYPQPYASYITAVSYRISYSNQDPAEIPANASSNEDFAYTLPLDKLNAIRDITATITLSSRMKVSLPIYSLPSWNTQL